jgi:hypothetical protein
MFDGFFAHSGTATAGRQIVRALLVMGSATLVCLAPIALRPAPAQDLEALSNIAPEKDSGFLPPNATVRPVANPISRPDVLDLEPAVAQAELILAVRLVDVTETKIVHGGRNVEVTQQYRFEPVRFLKGIFARGELLMTGQDLGIYRFAEGSDRLERGQLMLILLGRQGQDYFNCNCNGVPTLGQSIPRLEGKDDPLLAAVDVLIGMTRRRDRTERVALLRDGLKGAKGRDASALLLSLGRRALVAALDPGVAEAVLPHLKSPSPAIREVAARTLATLLDSIPAQKEPRDPPNLNRLQTEAGLALAASLADSVPDLAARVAVIDALGSAGGSAIGRTPAALTWLNAKQPAETFAETAARLRVLGKLPASSGKDEVVRSYETLLLDAPADIQEVAGRTLGRLDARKAAELISARLARKDEAGLDVALEMTLLGELPREIATPALLKAWNRSLDPLERLAFARACADVADARLVPAVSTLLDPRQWQTRAYAMEALRRIDTDEAASALWPHLDEEADVARKLRLIAFLGRHGFREGYAQALEHLSQAALREEAVAAIAAIGEPRAIPELRRIWQTSNDLAWNAAAIRALARLGQQDIAPKLLEIARTPGDPLADSALIGLGDLGSAEALPIVREALASRRDEIVIAAARAAAMLLVRPELKDDGIRDRLAALLADPDASPPVRQSALRALVALDDSRLGATLATVAHDANLEGTPLLDEVELALSKAAAAR